MASSYPTGLDNFATTRADATSMATTHKDDHNNYADAINKIEAELGTSPSGAFATVAARLAAGTGGGISYNVLDFGAVGDGVTDDTTAVADALAYAGDPANAATNQLRAIVYFPTGSYKLTGALELPTYPDIGVSLLGDGPAASVLHWSTDLGSGTFGMSPPAGIYTSGAREPIIRGLMFRGPGTLGSLGTAPCNMNGLRLPSRARVYDCQATLWRTGFDLSADHWFLLNVAASGCYYGIYYGKEINAESDQGMMACDFTGNWFASIGICPSNVMGGSTIADTHLGYTPYCIYKEDPDNADTGGGFNANSGAVMGCTFVDCSFENYAHGMIFCEGGTATNQGLVQGNVFVNCGHANAMTVDKDIGASRAWNINCSDFSKNIGIGSSVLTAEGSSGWVDATTCGRNRIVLKDPLAITGRPVSDACTVSNSWIIEDGEGRRGDVVSANGTIAANELLYAQLGGNRMNLYPTSATHAARGVAAQAATSGQRFVMWRSGPVTFACTDATVTDNSFVKPDGSNAGRVVKSTGWADGPIVGVATANQSGSTVVGRLQVP